MDYYKINYKKLENMYQIKYYVFIIVVIVFISCLLTISCFTFAYKEETFYGLYNDNILSFKINNKLSDLFKEQNIVSFNNKEINYKIVGFSDYEVVDNEVYEKIELEVDEKFYQNEFGKIKIYFDKKRIIFHILELFK